MVRNFDIAVEEENGEHFMIVAGFRNYDEALQYARQLYAQKAITRLAGKCRRIIISAENLPLLGTQVSYDDYDKFYIKHFAPLKISKELLLEEPDIIVTEKETGTKDFDDEYQPETKDNSTFFEDDADNNPKDDGVTIEQESANPENTDNGNTVVPLDSNDTAPAAPQNNPVITDTDTEEKKEEPTDNGNTILEEEKKDNIDDGSTIIPLEETEETVKPDKPAVEEKQIVPTPKKEDADENNKKVEPEKKEQDNNLKPAKDLEDEFYFDEDNNDNVGKNKNNKKKEDDNIDDEYYDLDGF